MCCRRVRAGLAQIRLSTRCIIVSTSPYRVLEQASLCGSSKSNGRGMACVVQRSWKHSTLGSQMRPYSDIRSFARSVQPLSKIPWPKPIIVATSSQSKYLFGVVSVWLRRCLWCLTSNNQVYLFLSKFLLDVYVNCVRATASGGVDKDFVTLITRDLIASSTWLAPLGCHPPEKLWLHPARTLPDLR